MIKVAVKFCGGCDPAFERVEYLEKIKAAAKNHIQWVLCTDSDYEAILLISGCQTACPEDQLPRTVPIVSLKTDEMAPQQVVRMLIGKGAK